jgi:hypothetical protein
LILIETNKSFSAQKDYVFDFVFKGVLGIPWRRLETDSATFKIRLNNDDQKYIKLPDVFFDAGRDHWLSKSIFLIRIN